MSSTKTARLVRRNVKPVFQHDCDVCRFIGRLDGQDLYLCGGREYVRRFGNSDCENGSLGDFAPPGSPYALTKALVARGVFGNEYVTVGGGDW